MGDVVTQIQVVSQLVFGTRPLQIVSELNRVPCRARAFAMLHVREDQVVVLGLNEDVNGLSGDIIRLYPTFDMFGNISNLKRLGD